MRPTQSCFRRSWIVFLLISVVSVSTRGQEPLSIPAYSAGVAETKGAVDIVLPGQSPSHPSRGQPLPAGTVIQTASGRILLNLSDGSQVLIYPQTRVLLKEPSLLDADYLRLLMGEIRAQISKRTGGSPSFQLGTPSAIVTVRGTRFLVEANPAQVTEVDVLEGVVEVTGIHQPAKSLTLERGFSARIPMDGDPEGPLPTNEIRPDLELRGGTGNDSESEKNGGFEDRNDASESPASGQIMIRILINPMSNSQDRTVLTGDSNRSRLLEQLTG